VLDLVHPVNRVDCFFLNAKATTGFIISRRWLRAKFIAAGQD